MRVAWRQVSRSAERGRVPLVSIADRMAALEAERRLRSEVDAIDAAVRDQVVELHPAAVDAYRKAIDELQAALAADPQAAAIHTPDDREDRDLCPPGARPRRPGAARPNRRAVDDSGIGGIAGTIPALAKSADPGRRRAV
jgi:hypothetical protein